MTKRDRGFLPIGLSAGHSLNYGCLVVCALALNTSCSPSPGGADLVLHDAHIITINESSPSADAIALKNGNIVAVGSFVDVEPFIGPGTKVITIYLSVPTGAMGRSSMGDSLF